MKIGLTIHPINDGNKSTKRSPRQVNSRPKGVHAELATESIEEAKHLSIEVLKGKTVRNLNGVKSYSTQPWKNRYPPRQRKE